MQEQAKSPKKKRGWLWLLVGVLLIAVLIAPFIRSYSLQLRAGRLIRSYVDKLEASETNPTKGNFYCLLPSLYKTPESTNLDQAILWLNQARSIPPVNAYSSFLLGQAYCLKQEYQQAVDAFNVYLAQRPNNLLAKAEAGFADVAIARSTSDPQNTNNYLSKGILSLQDAGFSDPYAFTKYGDEAFKQGKYHEALVWYEISNSSSLLDGSRLFRYALLKLVLEGSSSYIDQIKDGMILELDEDLTIEPDNLFILSSGASIQTRVEADQPIGILYSNSQEAGILLKVSEANSFCFSVQALDKQPAPTKIGLKVDFKTLPIMELVNGNGNWVQFNLDLRLDPGIHIFSIKLMNDSIVGGVDRNAYFGSIRISRCN